MVGLIGKTVRSHEIHNIIDAEGIDRYIGRITYKPEVYMYKQQPFWALDGRAKVLEVSWQPSLSNYLTV
ncbi:hypothetical protein M0802_000783 [Mischocyttarus mexicanus]|nr:hypothetical protein M0802_015367 [Mischocyttarus mexicanus]KAI4504312.1 hypothetical protein M0802_000783 [Mischocyttarus mexicanus]